MATTTLLELTGVSAADLAEGWPHARIRPERGGDYDADGSVRLIEHLNLVARFDNIHSFVAPDGAGAAIGITADLHVDVGNDPGGRLGAVHRNLSDFTLRLARMDGNHPARLMWTRFDDGTSEVVVLGLPVEMHLPMDLLMSPVETTEDNNGFDSTRPDSLGVRLETGTVPSVLSFFTSLRVTRAGEVLISPNVPVSIGRCIFMGLPCRAVHGLAFLPDVGLADPSHPRELPIGWAQPIGSSPEEASWNSVLAARLGGGAGLMTVRTIDLDRDAASVKQVYDFLATNVDAVHPALEIPIEDLALAFDAEGGFPTPAYPLFGLTGLRREVNDDTAAAEPFDHRLAPIILPIRDWLYVHLHRLLLGWTDNPVLSFDLAITRDTTAPEVNALTVNFTQEYILRIGWAPPAPKKIFKVGNAKMSLLALRGGLNLGALYGPYAQKDPGILDLGEALLDLAIVSDSGAGDDDSKSMVGFRTRSGGTIDVALRDVGWKAGAPSASAWVPDGIDLSLMGRQGFHIDEIGLATTTHGASYVRLSASFRIGNETPLAEPEKQNHPTGSGIWIRGLRIRVQQPEDVDAPLIAIDGIVLAISAGGFEIEGGGWLRDEVVGDSRVRELGFGLRIVAPLGATQFILSALLVKGSVESPTTNFGYVLAGLTFGPIPFGSFQIIKASILIARNYLPRLPAPTGIEQNLRMLKWYRSQPNGLELPPSRVLGAWEPSADSWAVGLSLRLGLGNSAKVKLDGFGLWLRTPETWSLLVGLELRWEDLPDPIGWIAVEYDDASGRWGATGGLSLGVKDVLKYEKLPALARVSGAVFISNSPKTVALGHIEDVDSWLQFKIQYERFDLLLRIGMCFYDYDGDPPMTALGFVITGRGRASVAKLAEFSFLLEVVIRVGSFSSDGVTTGIKASIEAAFRIKVWRLNFGLHGRIEVEQIHPEPEGGRATIDLSIETPWFLPDLHVSHTWEFGNDADMSGARVVSLPVSGGKALRSAGGDAIDLVAPLPSGADDPARPYSIGELITFTGAQPREEDFAALTPVSVDSIIAIDFAAAMNDLLGTGETTPMTASRQTNGEIYCDYEVIELGIRRRARYGDGTWTDLIDPQTTSTAAVDPINATVEDLVASYTSQLSMHWDRDNVRGGKLDARRLLLNSATPFTLTAANPIADEALLDDPSAMCCGRKFTRPWVRLDFESSPLGVRLPPVSAFPGGGAHVRWHGVLPPVITEAESTRWARIPLTGKTGQTLATVRFDRLVSRVAIRMAWSVVSSAVVRIELHRGLRRVSVRDVPLGVLQAQSIEVHDAVGADRLVIRLLGGSNEMGALYVDTLAYVDREREIAWLKDRANCQAGGSLGGGTLAWLPNHDYEVTVKSRTIVGHDRQGSLAATVEQSVLFRTKGLPGLNVSDAPGGDLAPFIEAQYPARASQLLYRDEPVLLVMNERFAPLAPAVDAPPTAPPERRQLLEWSMLVDQVGKGAPGAPATHSSPDWLSEHRQQPGPLGPPGARGDAVRSHIRHAASLDARLVRLDAVKMSPANCQPKQVTLHDSRIYSCDAPAGGWAHAAYRVRIVQRGGPYVLRNRFETVDLSALTLTAEGGPAGAWSVAEDGALVVPVGAQRAWAVLGENAWMHLHMRADVDPAGGAAGLAIAISGDDALVALIDDVDGELRLERRLAGVHEVLARAALPPRAGPVQLDVIGFDDAVLARVGQVELRAERGEQRGGRVALLGTAGARFSSFAVEPVEALAIDFVASRWHGFAEHVAAHRDNAPLMVESQRSQVSAWLTAQWDALNAVMTPDADPRSRGTLFRQALETIGIARIEDPTEPSVTVLRSEGASLAFLIEGPEAIAFSRDVKIRLQRRRRVRPPFGDVRGPLSETVRSLRRRAPLGEMSATDRFDLHAELDLGHDRDLFPINPVQWVDIETVVLTDDTEKSALIVPVNAANRTLLTSAPGVLRLVFEMDRERYRSATADAQARYGAMATRVVSC